MSRRPPWWLDALRILWPLNHIGARMTGWPIIGRLVSLIVLPLFKQKNFNITYIPVNLSIKNSSTVLPRMIIEDLIRRSSYRVSINRCSCRDSKGCKNYPIEDSCMLLGDDTRVIDRRISKHLGVDEAVAQMERKISLGLIPMTGRVRMDDFFYGVPNRGRMLTICFCCPCCCTILGSARFFPPEINESLVRLKGVKIEVDHEKCRRCGTCASSCLLGAISLDGGRVVRDDMLCKGCGICENVCPERAVVLNVEDAKEAVSEIMGRIGERINIG